MKIYELKQFKIPIEIDKAWMFSQLNSKKIIFEQPSNQSSFFPARFHQIFLNCLLFKLIIGAKNEKSLYN